MRKVTKVIIHCTASGPKTTLEDVRKWHKSRGFNDVGYHYVILNDGRIAQGRDLDTVGAHCEGHNSDSIGISLVGGTDGSGTKHPFFLKQYDALNFLLEGIMLKYGQLDIYPHNYFNKGKACPDFNIGSILDAKKFKKIHG